MARKPKDKVVAIQPLQYLPIIEGMRVRCTVCLKHWLALNMSTEMATNRALLSTHVSVEMVQNAITVTGAVCRIHKDHPELAA